MKILLLVLFIYSLLTYKVTNPSKVEISKWVISENSSLVVNGSTNVNHFSCRVVHYSMDTIKLSQDDVRQTLSGNILIEVKSFECNIQMMTKELRKTLNESEFPILHINLLSLKQVSVTNMGGLFKGNVEIEIAGKAKNFVGVYELAKHKDKMVFKGTQSVNFSDFELKPPVKVGRLIKAKDGLTIVFTLILRKVK